MEAMKLMRVAMDPVYSLEWVDVGSRQAADFDTSVFNQLLACSRPLRFLGTKMSFNITAAPFSGRLFHLLPLGMCRVYICGIQYQRVKVFLEQLNLM